MIKPENLLDIIIAKLPRDGAYTWLPLNIHLEDTFEVSQLLWENWLGSGIKSTLAKECGGNEKAKSLLGFFAYAHDIGKATPDMTTKFIEALLLIDKNDAQEIKSLVEQFTKCKLHTYAKHIPHGLLGEAIALELGVDSALASVIGAHHGQAVDSSKLMDIAESYEDRYKGNDNGEWTKSQQTIIDRALSKVGVCTVDELSVPNQPALVLLCALVIMADWIASNETYFKYIPRDEVLSPESSKERAQRALEKMRLPKPWNSSADAIKDVSLLFEKAKFGFDTPNEMQLSVVKIIEQLKMPGIVILEAPMGQGKTEAALAAAELMAAKAGKTGVFFALPTQTTSNGVFKRLKRWSDVLSKAAGENHSIRLVHGAAHLNEDYYGLFENKANIDEDELTKEETQAGVSVCTWFEGGKKALLADFVVGTVDQLLMAALKRRHVMLRHIGLAGKVVIIDECHAYDTYMMKYLERMLKWLRVYNVPVIILSATLPAHKRTELINAYMGGKTKQTSEENILQEGEFTYPLITYSDGDSIKYMGLNKGDGAKNVSVKPLEYGGFYACVDEIASKGGCLGIVVNTVKKAQEMMAELKTRYPQKDIRLFHSRFVMEDRAAREKTLLEDLGKNGETRPENCIIIGTQVLEQSLDIDFDVMISEICPIDLLLQRIGRLHRHERRRPNDLAQPICYVLGGSEDITPENRAVYGEYLIKMTQLALPKNIEIPKDIPYLVEKVYGTDNDVLSLDIMAALAEYKTEEEKQQKKAKTFLIKEPWLKGGEEAALDDWQNTNWIGGEKSAESAVRDAAPSLEVIALWQNDKGELKRLWNDDALLSPARRKGASQIAAQRLRLPWELCAQSYKSSFISQSLIDDLEEQTAMYAGLWQESPLLKGELLLLFNNEKTATIGDYILRYDGDLGLLYEKTDKQKQSD